MKKRMFVLVAMVISVFSALYLVYFYNVTVGNTEYLFPQGCAD